MRIVVGITGGIAAYKSATLVRSLTESGHEVQVIATPSALNFIGAATLEALSHKPVLSELFTDVQDVKHIQLASWAELIVVAPATAAFLARYANGLADDLLTNVLLATTVPVYVAPAMHTEMWNNAATKTNVAKLQDAGVTILWPTAGRLTGNDSGVGRLMEPEDIAQAITSTPVTKTLIGKKFLVTAGGTREPIDAVRFIGNRSSGKQGIALANALANLGATVTLIACNVPEKPNGAVRVVAAETFTDLELALNTELAGIDGFIMAAAVSDFAIKGNSAALRDKLDSDIDIELPLTPHDDLLAKFAPRVHASNSNALVIGFAAEAEQDPKKLIAAGVAKLNRKDCDLLIANDISDGKVFDKDNSAVFVIDRDGNSSNFEGSKVFIAQKVVEIISQRINH